ncbi:hypothetical protein M9Y10_000657 [Tritrichomonas musculus]|uniref:MSP domain-containing protein n=1 Tax=Tritrichomonas musculus TaxID=1915356 RepID=A0ABR2L4T5_9EUKA
MSINTLFGLNLRVLSFELPRSLIKDNDQVRVSVTTIPEENKQAFTISARQMKDSRITFCVNVNIQRDDIPNDLVFTTTEKIIVVFRKKSLFAHDPIIASTSIHVKDLPKNLSQPAEIKMVNIYEPKKQLEKKNNYQKEITEKDRKVIGRMQVEMSLTEPVHLKEFKEDQMFDLTNDNNCDVEVAFDGTTIKDRYFGFKKLRL